MRLPLIALIPVIAAIALPLFSCRTPASRRALDVGDEHFALHRDLDAASAYDHAMTEAQSSDEELRAELFALLARRAATAGSPESVSAVSALEDFAATARSTAWGRAAAVVLDEIKRGDVLREELLRAGAEREQVEERSDGLAQELATAKATLKAEEAELASLRDERASLTQHVRELDEKFRESAAHESALSSELSALKQIDLQHRP